MFDAEGEAIFPLSGFNVGLNGGVVALRVEYATTSADYSAQVGDTQQYVMSPTTAIMIGQALIEHAARVGGGSRA